MWNSLGAIIPTFDWEPGPSLGVTGSESLIKLVPEYLPGDQSLISDVIFRREFIESGQVFAVHSPYDRAFSFFPNNLQGRLYHYEAFPPGLDIRLSIRLEKPRSLWGFSNGVAIASVKPIRVDVFSWS